MELQCKILLYLDKRRYLTEMKSECEKFCEELNEKTINKFPALRFLLEIDVMDVLDTFPELGELLLQEPLKFQQYCSEILFACLQGTKEEPIQNIRPAQLAALVRFKSMPKVVTSIKGLYSGLVAFEGLLIAMSKPTKYVYHTVWSCPEECEGSEVILQYIPKAPPKCHIFRSVLFENSGMRRCGEQIVATVKMKSDVCSKYFYIVEDLISRLALGSIYSIHAAVVKKLTIVMSLEEIVPLSVPVTSPIPKDIEELHQACDGIPWKFIYCLASSIGFSVCPLNCFMHLKINLLVSLSSVKANMLIGSNIVHVLVAGFDTRYVSEIMIEAAKLADRSIVLGTSNSVVSTALLSSSGGVCVMPLPLHVYSQKQTSAILSAVESGEVMTDTAKAKLQSAVWAQGMDFKKIIFSNVASVFRTICRGDLGEYNDEIADFVLQRAIEPVETNDEEKQTLEEVALYIDLVAGIEVVLDDRAETLLRDYFLAARKERPRAVSVCSMNALVATCVTSARLCRRTIANVDDAVLTIWLHVSSTPEPRFAPKEYLDTPSDVKKLDKMMNNFKHWLEQFADTRIF